jgi:hypothetical protein
LIINWKLKGKIWNLSLQSKYKYYCSRCNTLYIVNTLQFYHCNCHSSYAHARPRSSGAGVGDPRGCGGPQVSSVKECFFYQDKPRCIPPIIFDFSFNHYLYIKIDCALSLLDLVETVITLWSVPSWLSFWITLLANARRRYRHKPLAIVRH